MRLRRCPQVGGCDDLVGSLARELNQRWKQSLAHADLLESTSPCPSLELNERPPPRPSTCADLTIVTAAEAAFFDSVQNLVASIQTWEPHARIILYDLGLDAAQAITARNWLNVEYRPFALHCYYPYGKHFMWPQCYAWKPMIIKEVLDEQDCMLYLDGGVELRGPLDTVKQLLSERRYFLVGIPEVDRCRISLRHAISGHRHYHSSDPHQRCPYPH